MKKKVLSSILLTILLASNLSAPVVTALDSSGSSEPSSSMVQQNDTKTKVSIEATDSQTQAVLTDVDFVLKDKESKKEVSKWTSSDTIKELELEKGKTYLLETTKAGYEDTKNRELKLDQDGKVYLLQDDKSWQEQASAKVSLPLSPTPASEVNAASGEEQSDLSTEEKTTQKVTFPKVNLTSASNAAANLSAEFKLLQENNSSEIAQWASTDDSPEVELEAGVVYRLRFTSIQAGYIKPDDISLRLTTDGKFEILNGQEWKAVETIDVSVNRKSGLRVGSSTQIAPPIPVSDTTIAPINRLQIIGNMPATSRVDIIDKGEGVSRSLDVRGYDSDNAIWAGSFSTDVDPVIANAAPNHNAQTIEFKPSNYLANNYQNDANVGWDARDLSLDTTRMWVKVKYTDAAYYDGQLVDAVATIKVTPYKNRTTRSVWNQNGGYNYWGNRTYADDLNNRPIYYPTIQVSGLLFGGWTRQNVNEFSVDIEFYAKGSSTPITLKGGTFDDTEATFYTINSLNPEYNYTDGAAHGPEYVLPETGTITAAYKTSNSNIKVSYDGDDKVQYAYHGGVNNGWGDADDKPTAPNWSKNSALFTTTNTTHIKAVLGDLMRKPGKHELNNPWVNQSIKSTVYRTNYIWSTISTEAFTNNKVINKDIPVQKTWSDPNNEHSEVTVELYATWKQDGVSQREFRQSQILNSSNEWKTVFKEVPNEESMEKIIQKQHPDKTISDFKYEVVEKDVPSGYSATYAGTSTSSKGFNVTNKKTKTGLVITKKWWSDITNKEIPNSSTTEYKPITVTLKRKKASGAVDTTFSQSIQLTYAKKWTETVDNLDIKDGSGKYTYYIEEDQSTIPDNFYLKGYSNKDGIQLTEYTVQNKLDVTNADSSVIINFEKLWFNKDNKAIANDKLPTKLTIKLYRTTNGQASNGQLVDTITLTRSSAQPYVWKIGNYYPAKDKTGKYYTYYIEEELPKGYLETSETNQKKVTFTDANIGQSPTLTVKNKVNPVYPLTGGLGILPYLVLGIISLFTAVILYYMQKTERFLGGK